MEGELSPLRRVYPDALMEHLGHAPPKPKAKRRRKPSSERWFPLPRVSFPGSPRPSCVPPQA